MSLYPVNVPQKQYVPISWPGASGTRYEFQLDAFGAIDYYEIEGVYIFCKPAGNGNYWPIYVGETDNFRRRLGDELRSHHALPAILRQGATHISTLSIRGDRSYRLYVETDLRNGLKPPCNQQ